MSFTVESSQWVKALMAILMIFGPVSIMITGLRRERKPETRIGSKKGYCPKVPCESQAAWDKAQSIAGTSYVNGGLVGFLVSALLTVAMVLLPLEKAVRMLPVTVALQCAGLCLLHAIINAKIRKALKDLQTPESTGEDQ